MTDGTSPRVALIVTGGTIAALADDPLEILHYGGAGARGIALACGRGKLDLPAIRDH